MTVSCPSGTDKFLLESVGKGYYEVVGTLNAGNSIQEMQTVFMGENLGARLAPAAECVWALARAAACVQARVCERLLTRQTRLGAHPNVAQTRACTSRWSS